MPEFIKVCEEAARAGGEVLRSWQGRFSAREKGPSDLVTEADTASQDAIRRHLLSTFPDHGFLGEEQGANLPGTSGYRWIVDPLDGTTNYVHQLPQYCVSIGLEKDGELVCGAVYDPCSDDCYTAAASEGAFLNGRRIQVSGERNISSALIAASFPAKVRRDDRAIADFIEVLLEAQAMRRLGSSALNLCFVAAGRMDGYFASDTKIWDVAAGVLLVREAGGIVTALDGGPFELASPRFIAAATPELRQQIQHCLDRAAERHGQKT